MTREELERRLTSFPDSGVIQDGIKLIEKAIAFSAQAHAGQTYDEGEPYTVHCFEVEDVLIEFDQVTSVLRAAAHLHDVPEDTKVTLEQLREEFPGFISFIVEGVTNEPGKNRKERNHATYPKIRTFSDRIILKLADRIANVRRTIKNKDSRLSMYKKEYPEFRKALHISNVQYHAMWDELDRLLG